MMPGPQDFWVLSGMVLLSVSLIGLSVGFSVIEFFLSSSVIESSFQSSVIWFFLGSSVIGSLLWSF